jgi:hypothetical protein
MRYLIAISTCLLSFSVFGQGWEIAFEKPESQHGHSVQQTTDGGYIISGSEWTFESQNEDVYLLKTDANGVEQWNQTYGGEDDDWGYSVQQTTDGGYIIAGTTWSFGNVQPVAYLIKTDGNGVEQWNQTYGVELGCVVSSVQQTTFGGYILCGNTSNLGGGNSDIYLIKTHANGVEQWSQTYEASIDNNDIGKSVQQTTDGGYIICGYTGYFGSGDNDIYLIKTDGNGIEQWNQTYDGEEGSTDWSESVQQTLDGGYIIAGTTGVGLNEQNVYLLKTNSNGVEQWNQTYGGTSHDVGKSVQQTTDGGYIITGSTHSFGYYNSQDVYLIKTDGNGVEQWSQTYDGSMSTDWGMSVQQTTDGGYIIGGTAWSFGTGYDIYLIKTDSYGTLSSSFTIPASSSNKKLEKVIDALGREVNHTTNQILFHLYDDGSVEKKFVVE